MASAKIILQQNGDGYSTPASRDDLVLNLPVTVLNQDNTGVSQWLWAITDKPSGSTASLVAPTASTTTFTPDIEGTYLIKLVLNGGTPTDQKGAAVKTANYNYRIPAATETTEFDAYRGWATAANLALKLIDDGYLPPSAVPTLQSVYDASSSGSFTLNSTNNGLQIHDASPSIGVNLFEVDAYGNGTKYLAVNSVSSTFTGQLLQTGGLVGFGTTTPGAGYTNLLPDLSVHVLKPGHNMFLIDTGSTAAVDAGLVFYTNAVANDAAIFLDESDSQKFKIALGAVDSDSNRNANTKLTIQQSGAVGIGTTSPSSQLHVVGTGRVTGILTMDSGFSAGAQSTMGGFKIISVADPTNAQDAATKNYVDSLIGGTGNLSGALTTPRIPYATSANTLSDSGNLTWDNANSILKVQNAWVGNRVVGSENDNQQFSVIGGQVGGSSPGGSINLGGGTRIDSLVSVIQFKQAGTEIARFQGDNTNSNAGSLGIGTTDPRFKIDVYGSGHINTRAIIGNIPTNDPGNMFVVTNQTISPRIAIQGHVSAAPLPGIEFYDATASLKAQFFTTLSTGSVTLDYDGYQSSGSGVFRIRNGINALASALYIDSYGNTGINTIPSTTLDVSGDMHVSGLATVDGTISVDGYVIDPGFGGANTGDSLVYNGSAFVPTTIIVPIISNNSNLLLTTISATNVVSYTPPSDGDYVVFIYYRVVTATTTLTIDVTWNDASGAESFAALSTSAQTVGSYSIAPLYITATTSAPIIVTATAATANRVYVSASTMSVMSSVNTGAEPAVKEEADIFDYQLTTTSPTNVLSFTPPINENFFVYIYYRVANATTNVTINLTFNDGAGPQVLNILTITSKAVGSYTVAPVYIQATITAPISVEVTAGTANNVYVSATIMMV